MNKKAIFILLQLVFCFLIVSNSFADTLAVGDGVGLPGVHDKTVGVSLDNSVTVKSVVMYVCDVDNFLHCSGCAAVGHASGMNCSKTELSDPGGPHDGCVLLSLTGGTIDPGSGDIITLTYNVNIDAPEGECRDLNPVDEVVLDTSSNPISVTPVSGEFCYKCISSGECMDSLYCNGEEFCDDNGVCQLGHCSVTDTILCSLNADCPGTEICVDDVACPDDTEFCNGLEYCIEIIEQCGHTGNPCLPQLCEEGDDSCYCTGPEHCDDGVYCTGVETCVGQVCQPGDNPCEAPQPVCDEDTGQCYEDDVTLTVEDGSGFPGATTRYYIDYDSGISGFNVGATLTALFSGSPKGSGVIKKVTGNVTAGTLELESFIGEVHNNWEITDDGVPAGSADADGELYHYYPVGDEVSLSNPYNNVVSISMNIYDEGDYLSCTGCDPVFVPEGRCSTNCTCEAFEQDGFCHVALACFDCGLGGCSYWPISTSTVDGPVLTVYYDVSEEIPPGCINLDPEVEQVQTWLGGDALGDLWALPVPGDFCDQCKGDFDCDGAVAANDVTDFLIDFGRGLYNNPCETEDQCNGDFDCDRAVAANDVTDFLEDFGRGLYNNPCARCTEPFYCIYE